MSALLCFGFSESRAATNQSVVVNATTFDLVYGFSYNTVAGDHVVTPGIVIRSDTWYPLTVPSGADSTYPIGIYSAITPGAAAAGSYFGVAWTSVPEILAGNFIVPIGSMQYVEKFAWRVVAKNAGSNPRDLSIFSGANPNFVEIQPNQVIYLETSILWKAPTWRQMPFPSDAGMTYWPLRSFWQGLGVRQMDVDGGSWILGTEPESLPSDYPAGSTITGLGVGSGGGSGGNNGTTVVNVDLGPVTTAVAGTTAAVTAGNGILATVANGIASLISSVGGFFIDAILFFARIGDFITQLVAGTFAWIQQILTSLSTISGLAGDIFAKLDTAWAWVVSLVTFDSVNPATTYLAEVLQNFTVQGDGGAYMYVSPSGASYINEDAVKNRLGAGVNAFVQALAQTGYDSSIDLNALIVASPFPNIITTLTEGRTLALGATYQASDWQIVVSGITLSLYLPDIPHMPDIAAACRALFMLSFSLFLFWKLWEYTEDVLMRASSVSSAQTHNQSFLGINANWAAAAVNIGVAIAMVLALATVLFAMQLMTWNVDLTPLNQGLVQKGIALLCYFVPVEAMFAAGISFLGIRFGALPIVIGTFGGLKHGHA